MSEDGEIAGKDFTLPPAVMAVTNLTSDRNQLRTTIPMLSDISYSVSLQEISYLAM